MGIKFFYFLLTHLNILLASLLPSTDKSNNLSLQSQAGNYTAPFSHDIHRSQIHMDHNRMADTFPLQFLDIRTIHTRTYNKISIYKYHLINRDAKKYYIIHTYHNIFQYNQAYKNKQDLFLEQPDTTRRNSSPVEDKGSLNMAQQLDLHNVLHRNARNEGRQYFLCNFDSNQFRYRKLKIDYYNRRVWLLRLIELG